MNDLFYQVSRGCGSIAKDGKVNKADFGIPRLSESSDMEFSVFIFGHSDVRQNIKSNIFKCRDLLAYVRGHNLRLKREFYDASELDDAVSQLSTIVPNSDTKDFIVLSDISIDYTSSDVSTLFDNLYEILNTEFKDTNGIAVYWYLSEEDLEFVQEYNDWGTNFKVINDDTGRALILWK